MKIFFKFILFFALLIFASSVFAQQIEGEKGIEFYQKGNYEKAVEFLQKAVETDKKDRETWLFLGMSFAKLKKVKEAIKSFEKADKLPEEKSQKDNKDIKFISKPRVRYTESARQNLIQGTIKLAAELGTDGKIKYIFAFKTLPNGLTEGAIEADSKILFEPVTKDGKPVIAIRIFTHTYTIH